MTRSERLVAALYDRRWLAAALLLALVGVLCVGAARVGMENRLEVWFLEDDPALQSYRQFQQAFGGEETVVVALHREGGMLDAEGQRLLGVATRALQSVPEVLEVRSLATVPQVRVGLLGPELTPLLPPDGDGALRARILSDPHLVKRLVSADGEVALALVRLRALPDLDARRPQILAALRAQVQPLPLEARFAGNGVIYDALNQAATVDSAGVLAGAYVVMVLLLALLFRRAGPVVVTLTAVGFGAAGTLGMMGWSGRHLNVVTLVVPTLVLILGIAECVHMLQHVAAEPKDAPQRERVARGVGAVLLPCTVTTLTSMAALLSLVFSPMPVVRDLGLFSAAGVAFAFISAVVACTFALRWRRAEPKETGASLLQRGATALTRFAERRPVQVSVVALLLSAGLFAALTRLEVDTDSLGYLDRDHPVRVDSRFIEARFGPYTAVELLVHAEGGATDAALLASIQAWQRRAEAEGAAGWSMSLPDALSAAWKSGTGRDGLPERPEALRDLTERLAHAAPEEVTPWRSGDTLRVTFGVPIQSARSVAASIERLTSLAQLPAGVRVEPSGYLPLYVRMMDHMVSSQLSSFGTAFLWVFALMGLWLRSWRLALLSVPANVLPVLGVLGVMGVAGIPLDAATVTIAALVLGLAVDDSVHFLHRLRREEARGAEGAVDRTVARVGQSILSTTLVLVLGFAVMGFAQVSSVSYFGLLLALAMLFAVVADLLVTPAVRALITRPTADAPPRLAVTAPAVGTSPSPGRPAP